MFISQIESELPYLSLVLWYRPMKNAETHVLPFCRVKRYEQPLLRRYNSLGIKDRSLKIAPYGNHNMLNSKIESDLLYLFLVLWYRLMKMAEMHILPRRALRTTIFKKP